MTIISLPYFNLILWIAFGVVLALLAWNIFLEWRFWQLRQRLKIFFEGKKADDLEGVMFEQIKRLRRHDKDLKELFRSSRELWAMASCSIQKVGVVRFNPFGDTGGNQSFAVALLDSADSGLVISSLFGREGTRIYTKPIQKAQSKYPLSQEEKEAIKLAQQ